MAQSLKHQAMTLSIANAYTRALGFVLRIFSARLMGAEAMGVMEMASSAMMLAINNQAKLPEVVGLNLQNNGAFSIQIAREIAVLGPLAVTALCLLLVFCSRRTLTPWLVSVFSLALPVLILVINTFPG